MRNIIEYGKKYPDLVYDIRNFFLNKDIKTKFPQLLRGINPELGFKCPMDFFESFKGKYSDINNKDIMIQPKIISIICEKLCENSYLEKFVLGGINNFGGDFNFYGGLAYKNDNETVIKEILINIFNSFVYGFKYIFDYNKKNVLPIYVKKGENQYTGTCFKTVNGIITAKHCIVNCDEVKIDGIDINLLKNSYILSKDNLDLVVIRPIGNYLFLDALVPTKGEVLDEIIVMGYPQHSGFNNFLTTTLGSIAAVEESYIYKHELILITSKVKGGNSGGPLINKNGFVVGFVTETSIPQGENYDQFGYDIAIPISYTSEIIDGGQKINENINFV
jgi:hypothetical protein